MTLPTPQTTLDDPPNTRTKVHRRCLLLPSPPRSKMATLEPRSESSALKANLLRTQARHSSSCPPNIQQLRLTANESEVLKAIRSFFAGFVGGPDGFRPQHLLDLVNSKKTGLQLLAALTSFVNTLLESTCPSQIIPILFDGNILALEKKSGGIRPIAVGYVWRRLAAKCANSIATTKLVDYFNPTQLVVGILGGCEAAVYAARRFIESMSDGFVVANLISPTPSIVSIETPCCRL